MSYPSAANLRATAVPIPGPAPMITANAMTPNLKNLRHLYLKVSEVIYLGAEEVDPDRARVLHRGVLGSLHLLRLGHQARSGLDRLLHHVPCLGKWRRRSADDYVEPAAIEPDVVAGGGDELRDRIRRARDRVRRERDPGDVAAERLDEVADDLAVRREAAHGEHVRVARCERGAV